MSISPSINQQERWINKPKIDFYSTTAFNDQNNPQNFHQEELPLATKTKISP